MTEKSVSIRIKATDETQRALISAKTALDKFQAAASRTLARRNLLTTSKVEAEAAAAAYREAGAASEALGRKTQGGVAGTKKQKAAFEESRRAAVQARDAYLSAGAALSSATGRRASFAAFDAVASGAGRAEGAIERLTAAQQRSALATDRATAASLRNGTAMARQSVAPGRLAGPLGLRPHELTNLGYQVNDLITQVASGTSPVQALAQQGGQIAQIFPRATMAILRMVPAIAAVTAVVGPFVAAFGRLQGIESNVRRFSASLAATADSGAYAATDLAAAARALDDTGASADEARKMVQQYIRDGLNIAHVRDFGDAARDLAKITGRDLVDANKLLSEGLTGTYDDFKALDSALNVATAAERRRIKDLYESGRAEEARRLAVDLTFRRLDEGAKKLDGPWSRSARNFGRAWSNLLTNVGNWPIIQGAIDLVSQLGSKLEWLTRLMAGGTEAEANARAVASGRSRLTAIDAEIAATRQAEANVPSTWTPARRDRHRREMQVQRDRLLDERVAVGIDVSRRAGEASGLYSHGPITVDTERGAKEAEDRARPSSGGGGNDSARETERRAEAQREFVAGLVAENAARTFQLSLLDETERQRRILTAVREAELQAAEVGLEVTGAQRAEIESTVGALYDAEQALKGQEVISRALLSLAESRGEAETRNAFVARRLAEDSEGWLWAQKIAYAGLLAAQWDVEDAARKRAEAEKAVADQVALRESLMESIAFYEAQGDRGRVADLKSQLAEVNAELVKGLDLLIAYWGAFDSAEARAAVENLTRKREEIIGTGKAAGIAAAEIESALSQGAMTAFDRFTAKLAETGNLFASLRDAFLQFAADFLSQIAKMIAQQLVLNLLKGGAAQGAIGKASGLLSALVRHEGGGTSGGPRRMVPLATFANATRYHTGGIAGLKPGEIPAILKRGEVIDPGDGSIFGKMGGGGVPQHIKVVNVLDVNDILNRALGSDEGEKIVLNFLNRNSGQVRAVIGG